MEKTQARLTEELAEVCRDYCNATWDEALNIAGVPVDSVLRQPRSIYYHPDNHEVPGAIPPPRAIPSPFTLVPEAKDKGKGTKPSLEAKNAAKAKEAKAMAKEA